MTTCSQGPKDTAGCDQELRWIYGKWYSPHYEPNHWPRLKRGTGKPRVPKADVRLKDGDDLGLAANATEVQVRAALKDANQALKQSGKVQ